MRLMRELIYGSLLGARIKVGTAIAFVNCSGDIAKFLILIVSRFKYLFKLMFGGCQQC